MRTVRDETRPSEMVVRKVMAASWSNFLKGDKLGLPLRKFLARPQNRDETEQLQVAA
jgi:hypothetical protein